MAVEPTRALSGTELPGDGQALAAACRANAALCQALESAVDKAEKFRRDAERWQGAFHRAMALALKKRGEAPPRETAGNESLKSRSRRFARDLFGRRGEWQPTANRSPSSASVPQLGRSRRGTSSSGPKLVGANCLSWSTMQGPCRRSESKISRPTSLPWCRLPDDWEGRYAMRPAEPLCESPRFEGTCYRAASRAGRTQGRGKLDVRSERALPVKDAEAPNENQVLNVTMAGWKFGKNRSTPIPSNCAKEKANFLRCNSQFIEEVFSN